MGASVLYGNGRAGDKRSGVRVDKLWTNASPASNFAAQDVSVDLDSYQLVGIVCNFGSGSGNQYAVNMQIFTVDNGSKYLMISADNNRGGERRFDYVPDDKKISFYDAKYNSSTNNAYLIPVEIYGIRI